MLNTNTQSQIQLTFHFVKFRTEHPRTLADRVAGSMTLHLMPYSNTASWVVGMLSMMCFWTSLGSSAGRAAAAASLWLCSKARCSSSVYCSGTWKQGGMARAKADQYRAAA